jgi:predicted DNA-binding transcriptional regulator AlpA
VREGSKFFICSVSLSTWDNVMTLYLTAKQLQSRYAVSDMTIWRWLHQEGLNFPRPIVINRRRLWLEDDLIAWEHSRGRRGSVAA